MNKFKIDPLTSDQLEEAYNILDLYSSNDNVYDELRGIQFLNKFGIDKNCIAIYSNGTIFPIDYTNNWVSQWIQILLYSDLYDFYKVVELKVNKLTLSQIEEGKNIWNLITSKDSETIALGDAYIKSFIDSVFKDTTIIAIKLEDLFGYTIATSRNILYSLIYKFNSSKFYTYQ